MYEDGYIITTTVRTENRTPSRGPPRSVGNCGSFCEPVRDKEIEQEEFAIEYNAGERQQPRTWQARGVAPTSRLNATAGGKYKYAYLACSCKAGCCSSSVSEMPLLWC